jgi:hypothetical protein
MSPQTRSAFLALLVASLLMAVVTVTTPAGAWTANTQVSVSLVP